jgi:hypothetical protein
MSAIEEHSTFDVLLNDPITTEHFDVEFVYAARAELVALRDTLKSWFDLWSYICKATNCEGYLPSESNFDSMLDNAPRYVQLRARIAELEAANASLETAEGEAREILDNIFKHDWSNRKLLTAAQDWLAAHPAPQAEQAA